ncbi:unnamed protein product, partial [Didymodactylos carnosus]
NEVQNLRELESKQLQLRRQHVNLVNGLEYEQNELYQHDLKAKTLENELRQNNEKQQQMIADKEKLERQIHEMRFKEELNKRNKLELSLNGLQELIRRTQEEIQEIQENLNREQAELARIETQIEELNAQIREKENEIRRINRDPERLNNKQQQLMLTHNDLRKQKTELEIIIAQLANVLPE